MSILRKLARSGKDPRVCDARAHEHNRVASVQLNKILMNRVAMAAVHHRDDQERPDLSHIHNR